MWLYFRFALSYRNIEEMMAKRGVPVTYETVREWCQKFGSLYALLLRRKRARIGSKWHLDEVFIKMNGVQHYLWRAVDENGVVIDILVQPKRDRWAALRFFRKLYGVEFVLFAPEPDRLHRVAIPPCGLLSGNAGRVLFGAEEPAQAFGGFGGCDLSFSDVA